MSVSSEGAGLWETWGLVLALHMRPAGSHGGRELGRSHRPWDAHSGDHFQGSALERSSTKLVFSKKESFC